VTNDPTGRRIPYFYLPFTQNYSSFHVLNVRSRLDAKNLSAEIERNVHKLMPGLAVMLMTMQDSLQSANGFFIFHLASDIAGAMAVIGFIVALVGIYGLISYSAAGRTHEVGVRMALGAMRREVLFMFLREGTVLVGIGLAIGALLAFGVARLMKDLLIGVSPYDPLTFIAAAVSVAAAAIFASYVPARHAARLDPMVALRHE
jgi:ABC-type antimicrobial peptide transport system permease subunit